MQARKSICRLLLWLSFFPFLVTGQSITDLTKLYPSQVAAYDLEEGLPISCTWNGILDKKGRLWINPCFQLPSYRTINFYQFDGRNSEMINLDGLPEGADGQAALACQNEEGLLFGFFRDSDHFFSFDPDSHETSFFQLDRKDASIIFMDYEPEFGLIVLAISPGKQYAYQLQKDTVELLMEYSSDIVSDGILPPYFYLQRRQVLSNGQLWFLDVPNNKVNDPTKWLDKNRFNLLQLDLRTRELKRYAGEDLLAEAPQPSELPSFKLNLTSDSQGHILLGMSGHIYQIDPQNGNTLLKWIFPYENFKDPIKESYRVEKDAEGNLLFLYRDASNKFLAILLDTNGKLYDYSEIMQTVARNARSGFELSYTLGVFSTDFLRNLLVFSEGGLVMVELSYHASISTHLKGFPTRAIMEWEPGQYLVRTENTDRYDGLYSINPFSSSNPEMIFDAPKLKEAQIPVDEYSNLIHRDGYYWYKSKQNLIRLDKNQDHLSFPVGIPFDRFTFLNAYTVAIAERNGALNFYDLNARERRPWLENGAPLQLKGEVNELLLTKDSTLWVASLQELLQIDLKSGTTRHIGKEQGFLDNRMMSLHEDEQGQLWVGTYGEGIHIYDPASGQVKVINQKSGLSNNTVIGILADEEGIRWASTYRGINLISPEGEVVGQLFQEDGLSTNEFNRYSYGKGSDGRLLFGSINGVNALDPETIKKRLLSDDDLSIYLRSITRFDADEGADRTQYVGFNELERLFLPAGHRHIVLDFALSSLIQPEEQKFAYRIDEAGQRDSSEWIYLGNQHQLYLPFLPSGRYDIVIRGSDYHGNWTPDPIIVPIQVGRFFYQQPWFYLMVFFVLAGAVLAWMLRQRALRKKLETELADRTHEIMETRDQLIVQEKLASLGQMVAGIAHEIKNPLNFVHNFSEGSLEVLEELMEDLQKPSNGASTNHDPTLLANLELLKQNIEFINQNGDRMNEIVSSMMHHAQDSSGEKLEVDINRLIDSNITLAYHGFRATHSGFQVNIIKDFAQPSPVIMAYPNELGRCLINLMDNACSAVLQKSQSDLNAYEPSIKVSTITHTDRVEIRVLDNGMGIPPPILDKIFNPFFTTKPTRKGNIGLGLSICHDIIVQQHKGKLSVKSEEGSFTEFIVELPV